MRRSCAVGNTTSPAGACESFLRSGAYIAPAVQQPACRAQEASCKQIGYPCHLSRSGAEAKQAYWQLKVTSLTDAALQARDPNTHSRWCGTVANTQLWCLLQTQFRLGKTSAAQRRRPTLPARCVSINSIAACRNMQVWLCLAVCAKLFGTARLSSTSASCMRRQPFAGSHP
jgi:hypothetical protein